MYYQLNALTTALPRREDRRTQLVRALTFGLSLLVLVWLVRDYDAGLALAPLLLAVAMVPLLLRPELATLVVLFLLYTNLPVAAYRLHGVPPAIAMSFTALMALPLAAMLLVRREPLRVDVTFRLLLVFLGVQLASSLFAPEPAVAAVRIITFVLEGVLLYWLIINLVRTDRMLRRALWAVVAAGSLLGGLSVVQVVTGAHTDDFGGLAQRKTRIEYTTQEDDATQAPEPVVVASERAAGPFGEPNRYAQILIVLLPLAAVLYRHAGERRERQAAAAAVFVLLAGVMLSFSRGALLTLLLLIPIAMAVRWLRPLHLAGLAVCVLLVIVRFAPGLGDRVVSIGGVADLFRDQPTARADGAIRGRATEMLAAAHVFLDHPLLGVGPGQYLAAYSAEYQQSIPIRFRDRREPRRAHNLYLELAAETGVVGLISFGLIVGLLLARLRRARISWAHHNAERADLALACMLMIGAYLITGLFLHLAFERYFWMMLALAAAALHVRLSAPAPIAAAATATAVAPARVLPSRTRWAAIAARPQTATARTAPGSFPRVAYIMSRFPTLTETFVLNEILALETMNASVEIYPLLREKKRVQHPEAFRLIQRAHFHPFISLEILQAQIFFLQKDARAYLQLWREVLRETWGSPNFFVGAIGIFPKAVCFAYEMSKTGVAHIHAHFANHPAVAAFIIHRLTGIPYSFTAHGSDLHVERRMLGAKVRESAFSVTISEYNRELMVKECGEGVRSKIHVVHCGIDPVTFAASSARKESGPIRIICVASFQPVKGHTHLVEACRILRERGLDFRCDLVGDGPLRGEIRRQILYCGLDGWVRTTGGLTRSMVATMLGRAHIAVLASSPQSNGKREGIPVALMEAMASELPVVATSISGIPELVAHGRTGLLVPPADPVALADALATLARDPDLRRRFGHNGRAKVIREFDLRENARSLLHLIKHGGSPVPERRLG